MNDSKTTEAERRAVERIRRAGVRASEAAMLAWVRSVGPARILSATLSEIRIVAQAF